MNRGWLAGIALLALSGCAERSTSWTVAVDPAAGADAYTAILSAAEAWERAAPGVTFEVVARKAEGFGPDHRAWPEHTIAISVSDPGPKRHAFTEWEGGPSAARIVLGAAHAGRVDVVAHELGHAMHLAHASEGVMRAFDPDEEVAEVTCSDVRQLCAAWDREACACGIEAP